MLNDVCADFERWVSYKLFFVGYWFDFDFTLVIWSLDLEWLELFYESIEVYRFICLVKLDLKGFLK